MSIHLTLRHLMCQVSYTGNMPMLSLVRHDNDTVRVRFDAKHPRFSPLHGKTNHHLVTLRLDNDTDDFNVEVNGHWRVTVTQDQLPLFLMDWQATGSLADAIRALLAAEFIECED